MNSEYFCNYTFYNKGVRVAEGYGVYFLPEVTMDSLVELSDKIIKNKSKLEPEISIDNLIINSMCKVN